MMQELLLARKMDYDSFTWDYFRTYKRPDVPENYTKSLFITAETATILMGIDNKFSDFFNRSTLYIVVINGYRVDSTNAFNTNSDNSIKIEGAKVLSNKQELRLGRVIKAFAGHIFTDLDIEGIVSRFKTKYEVDTSVVKISDDINEVYNISRCGGSCMANVGDWFDIYQDMGSRIAYILGADNKLRARALIHDVVGDDGNEYTVLDRIFYSDEKSKLTMQQWRKEQEGMTRMSYHEGVDFRGKNPISSHQYEHVPYVDNLPYVVEVDGDRYLASSDSMGYKIDFLQETSGASELGEICEHGGEDMVWCTDVDENCHVDDTYYCETDQEYYRYDDDLVYLSDGNYYRTDDDDIAYDEETGEYTWRDDLKYVADENIYTSSDEYIMCDHDGDYYHIDKMVVTDDGYTVQLDEATYIEDMGEYVYHTDNYYEHSD